MQGIVVS